MTRSVILCLWLLAAGAIPAAGAPRATKKAAVRTAAPAGARPRATAPPAAAANPKRAARAAGPPRRLEEIHIEGEIPAPQVLFVTARDQRRFTRFHHHRYLKTSVKVGETTPLPTWIAVPPSAGAGAP